MGEARDSAWQTDSLDDDFWLVWARRLPPAASAPRSLWADPQDDNAQWIANHEDTRLLGDDGAPTAWLPQYTLMRIFQWMPHDQLQVWVPRLGVVGLVQLGCGRARSRRRVRSS